MTHYRVTLQEASAFAASCHSLALAGEASTNPSVRNISSRAIEVLEPVMQWLDTREGVCPVDKIKALFGDCVIYEEGCVIVYPPPTPCATCEDFITCDWPHVTRCPKEAP